MPAKTMMRIGSSAFTGQFGESAEYDVKTTIVRNGRTTAHATPIDGLLVADRNVAPRQDGEELAVGPDIAPIVLRPDRVR